MENRQAPREASDAGNCVTVLVWLGCIILCMMWFGRNVGFDGVVSVIVALVVSALASVVIAGPVGWIAAVVSPRESPSSVEPVRGPRPQVSHKPSPNQIALGSSVPLPSSRTSSEAPRGDWRAQLRRQDPELNRRMEAFEKASAERAEYAADELQATASKVRGYWEHRSAYQHILRDPLHPDYPTVKSEMGRYRRAIREILRLRTSELQSSSPGGFKYREDLRTAEGLVEILRDDFEALFRELEND